MSFKFGLRIYSYFTLQNAYYNDADQTAGADSEFLEKGFICIKVWGFALLIFLKYPMKRK